MATEQDIFDFLGLEYVPPHERVNATSLRIFQVNQVKKVHCVKRPVRAKDE